MGYLLFVTLIQAFSFSLIGEYLAGHVDSYFAVLVRVVLAGLVFIPLTRWRSVEPVHARHAADRRVAVRHHLRLPVPELPRADGAGGAAVHHPHAAARDLIEDALNRRFNPWALVAALVAVGGAAVIRFDGSGFLHGFPAAATGQLHLRRRPGAVQASGGKHQRPAALPAFRLLLPRRTGGGVAGVSAVRQSQLPARSTAAVVLLFLGLVSTALGMYWWNKGACLVSGGTLAVMNNLHVPVGCC
jgi:drug/metabolite transporter (DMT)-like permease